MATEKEAEKLREKKAREPGKIRREKKRMEAAMRDRPKCCSGGVTFGKY